MSESEKTSNDEGFGSSDCSTDGQVEVIDQLHRFLQGEVPDGYRIGEERVPKLTADQAWTVIWYVQELHQQLSVEIERCDVCGEIYDSANSGDCLDYGESPHHFCDGCYYSEEHRAKVGQVRRTTA